MKQLILIFIFLNSICITHGMENTLIRSQDDLALVPSKSTNTETIGQSTVSHKPGSGKRRRKMLEQLGLKTEIALPGCIPSTDPKTNDLGTYYVALATNYGLYLQLLARTSYSSDDDKRIAFLLRKQLAEAHAKFVNLAIANGQLTDQDREAALMQIRNIALSEREYYGNAYTHEANGAYKKAVSELSNHPSDETEASRLERLERAYQSIRLSARRYRCAQSMGKQTTKKRRAHVRATRKEIETELTKSPLHSSALEDLRLAEKGERSAERKHKQLAPQLEMFSRQKRKDEDQGAILIRDLTTAETLAAASAKRYLDAYDKRPNPEYLADAERTLQSASKIRLDINSMSRVQEIPGYAILDGPDNLYARLRKAKSRQNSK